MASADRPSASATVPQEGAANGSETIGYLGPAVVGGAVGLAAVIAAAAAFGFDRLADALAGRPVSVPRWVVISPVDSGGQW